MSEEYDDLPIIHSREVTSKLVILAIAAVLAGLVFYGWTTLPPKVEGLNGTAVTWEGDYHSTTCRDLNEKMTEAEIETFAADVLRLYWMNFLDHDAKVPPEAAQQFRDQLIRGCTGKRYGNTAVISVASHILHAAPILP